MNWDEYFIDIASTVRQKSKDPSSKIGAVIVGPEKQILSTGYNGFARGIEEVDLARWERPLKYDFIVHAEENAIYNAARHGIALRGCSLYLVGFGPPTVPCTQCSKAIIQSGISLVVGRAVYTLHERWQSNLIQARSMLSEAGVEFRELP